MNNWVICINENEEENKRLSITKDMAYEIISKDIETNTIENDDNEIIRVNYKYFRKLDDKCTMSIKEEIVNWKPERIYFILEKSNEFCKNNIENLESLLDQLDGIEYRFLYINKKIDECLNLNERDYIVYYGGWYYQGLYANFKCCECSMCNQYQSPYRDGKVVMQTSCKIGERYKRKC